jgi:formylglycine-generating enzyme required for sulfatase activity
VVFVSRTDATAFCDWLTQRERKQGEERIAASHAYRLPTDVEWSDMAGLQEISGFSPSWRDAHKGRVFPWGANWPPPDRFGNFADAAAGSTSGVAGERTITGYVDGFVKTAPVGSFPANAKGIFDLAGNVYEWVADDYSIVDPNHLGVLRGGGWTSYQPEHLHAGSRYPQPPDATADIYGFRVVLAKIPLKTEPSPPPVSPVPPTPPTEPPPP